MEKWSAELPTEPGDYYMRDDGGCTLYEVCIIDGRIHCGPKSKAWRELIEIVAIKSTEWKLKQQRNR